MKKLLVTAACSTALVIVSGLVPASAQQAGAPQPAPQAAPAPAPAPVGRATEVPFQMQLVISRYQGEKRVSSLPYTLSMKATGIGRGPLARLNLGARVPVPMPVVIAAADGKPGSVASYNYENVGTNISSTASVLPDGRLDLNIEINETSVVTETAELRASGSEGRPVFRSYQSTNTIVLKDGETTQFTAASDRVSGEVVRVEVKVTVLK